MASPLGATNSNAILTEKEAAILGATLNEMEQGFSIDQTSYLLSFQPKKVLSRVENKKGSKTTFRAVNGSLVVLEDYGTAVTRFYS